MNFKIEIMKKIVAVIFILTFAFSACGTAEKAIPQKWSLAQKIELADGIAPIGLAFQNNKLWLADGDNNRVVQINEATGKIEESLENFERPMHLASKGNQLFIPEYGNDRITILENGKRDSIKIDFPLDAPAGIHVAENGDIAIADFYNHQVLLKHNNKWIKFGKKGKADGEFHYPTDVQIAGKKLYVADAYNNQVQVFDFVGKHLQTIGKETGLNAATGIFVDENNLFVTDFENNRVLIFDLAGKLQQIISENLEKPTDLAIHNKQLFVINYKGQFLNKYDFQ